jgi:hypothetical protein
MISVCEAVAGSQATVASRWRATAAALAVPCAPAWVEVEVWCDVIVWDLQDPGLGRPSAGHMDVQCP